ncbi:hypothetical protein ABIC56_000687 [Acinetobacter bereziniae]|uniref:hypothetical protein n=1 Tax=Acinetobacter bereziniae TaxID=106648 RepID=UPI0028641B8F|nr:hypothetical protein [Acinetobacter bereziniae]MDR6540144.1 hypothetical protein [Acinetobacter bereziniae]
MSVTKENTYNDIKKLNTIIFDCERFVIDKYVISNVEYNRLRVVLLDLLKEYKVLMDTIIDENGVEFINFNLLDIYFTELKNASGNFLHSSDDTKLINYLNIIIDNLNKILKNLVGVISEIEQDKLNNKIAHLDESIKNVNELKENIKNQETHDVYNLAATENQEKSDNFRLAFLIIIFVSIVFVWFCAVTKTYFGLSQYDYWFFKGTLVLTSVTLITYFLKQSVKYQKIADQCRQTKLELEAFPSFVASFTTEDPKIIEIRRELALKYFGRELDNSAKNETSSIISDQMKNTTELVKATTEAIKNLKTNQGGG